MKEEIKEKSSSVANNEILVIEDAEDLISIAQRRVETVQRIIEVALKITTYRDWVNQNGEPYLVHSGAEKVARLFGVTLSDIKTEKIIAEDTRGKFYIYKTTGKAVLPGKFDSIEALGTCSQRDKFFAKSGEAWLDTIEIDETNIMKASYSNFVVNAITHLLGLRNLTWDQLKEAGIDKSKILEIKYGKGTQKVSKTLSKEAIEIRKKIYDMALQMAGGDEKEASTFIKQESLFTFERDGKKVEKYAETIEQLTTEKWIASTYGRMKKVFEKAYPGEQLPFKEEKGK